MNEIMIDIETTGTKPGCAILSIGAVEFGNGVIGKTFSVNVDLESCTGAGLVIDPRTFMWWLEQSDEARSLLLTRVGVPLDEALAQLNAAFSWKGKKVWCNGASFDFPILEAGYKAFGAEAPWDFWSLMDFRTIKNMVSRKIYSDCKVKAKVAHDALEDAVAQAKTLMAIIARIEMM